MSAPVSESPAPGHPQPPQPSHAPRRRGLLSKLFLWTALFAAIVSIPQVFRSLVWLVLQEETLRQGAELHVDVLEGSLWEPLVLSRVSLDFAGQDGAKVHLRADGVRVEFAWRALLVRGQRRFIRSLRVSGGSVRWDLPQEGATAESERLAFWPPNFGGPVPLAMPSSVELDLKEVVVQSGLWNLRLEETLSTFSTLASGGMKIARLELNVGSWSRSFRDVHAKTAVQAGGVQLGDMSLMEGLKVSVLSAVLSNSSQGLVDVELQAQAFGGELRALAQMGSPAARRPVDASGTFSRLGVAPLAAFLNVTEAAGGTLEAGRFSFHGEPSRPERATASLRLEARNFQWESRQWDELVLGATLLDRRIQVPEFSLRQGHNQLLLNGDMQWPGGDSSWWKADFGVNVTARIENLTELSALVLPEFKYAAGGLTVDGAVRSQAGVLGGALIVSGSDLTWRNAPIEELHAAVKLQGSDIQVLNLELSHGLDWLRGKGSLKVGAGWSYQGELHGTVRDLGRYAALFQAPFAQEPFAGGVELDWSGKGGEETHEGRLHAKFSQVQPARSGDHWPLPLSGDFTGSYAKAGVDLESFKIGNSRVQVQGGARWGEGSLHLKGVSVTQGASRVLEGDFSVPQDVVLQFPKLNWNPLLEGRAPASCEFISRAFDLALLRQFPGVPVYLEGTLDGKWRMTGSPADFSGSGALQLRQGAWILESGLIGQVEADLELSGHALRASRWGWRSASGQYEGAAALEWKGDGVTVLSGSFACADARWLAPAAFSFPVAPQNDSSAVALSPVVAHGRANWMLSGSLSAPVVSGELVVKDIDFGGVPDLRSLWRGVAKEALLSSGETMEALQDWKLQLRVSSGEAAAVLGTIGAARVELQATGKVGAPEWSGEVRLALRGAAAGVAIEVEPLVVKFAPGKAGPELEARARGQSGISAFSASVLGPFGGTVREFTAEPPLSAEKIRRVFEEGEPW